MYKVFEINLNKYLCENIETGEVLEAIIKGKNKVYVGDFVDINQSYDKYIISNIYTRKNSLIRPKVVNIDQMVILVSVINPKLDYLMLDKQIIMCKLKDITPIICVNKIDLIENKDLEYLKANYTNIVEISAKDNIGLDKLKKLLKSKTTAFSGVSGVGKSTTLASLLNEDILTSEISKNNKGKHTTTNAKLYCLDKESFVVDTPGFNSFEIYDIKSSNLKLYYDEFQNVICDYLDCNHVNEGVKECAVKRLGVLEKEKYERYVKIYTELKEKEKYKKYR